MALAINRNITSRSDMIAAIRSLQAYIGLPVCKGVDDQAIGQQVIQIQKYLSTIPDASKSSGFRFDPAAVRSNISDITLPAAIIDLQNFAQPSSLTIPTTNLKAVWAAVRVNNWQGPCRRVQRGDGQQADIGFSGDVYDYAAEDLFAQGTAVTVVTEYDQSGNGYDRTQATNANRPVSSSLNDWNGVRPVTFDGFPGAVSPKFLDTPTTMAGINRNALSVYMLVSPRAPNQGCQYFEAFSDTGFATTAAYFIGAGGSQGAQFGSGFVTNNKYPRAHLQTLAVVSNGTNIRFRFDGDDKTIATGATSLAVPAFRFGKLSVNGNYNVGHDVFFTAIYAQVDVAATNLTLEKSLNATFSPDRAGFNYWSKQLITDGSSLDTGYFATSLQNPDWQGGFGRGGAGNVREWEYYNMAIGGTTAATAYSTRTRVTGLFNLAYGKIVVLAPTASNDIAGTTYTGVVDAQTGNANSAQAIFNNVYIPYVQAMQAAGATRVILRTTIPRTGFNTTSNYREIARQYLNNLIIANAATYNYVVADVASIPELQTFDPTYYASDNIHLTSAGYTKYEAVQLPLILGA